MSEKRVWRFGRQDALYEVPGPIKSCPFCGSNHLCWYKRLSGSESVGFLTFAVLCADCKGCGPNSAEMFGAVAAWNRRVAEVSVDGE